MTVREQLLQWCNETNSVILERHAEVRGLVYALLTRKNICLVGPGGTAKSLVGRMLAEAVGGTFWDYQHNKFTTPDEVFGPPSIAALKEGIFRRVTKGKLPEAVIALGDELFEANSAILNSYRKILNEKLFENDGDNQKVPLEVFIAATNLIPTEETLAAMYDRLQLRYLVRYLTEPAHFIAMLEGPKTWEGYTDAAGVVHKGFKDYVTVRLTMDDVHGAQADVRNVVVPRPVAEGMVAIRATLGPQGIIPSDRRWNEAYEIVRAKAWLQGRTEAQMDDLSVLADMLWTDPQHRGLVQGTVLEIANPLLKVAEQQRDGVEQAWSNMVKVEAKKEKTLAAAECLSKVNEALKKLDDVKAQGEKAAMDMSSVDAHIEALVRIQDNLQTDYLGLKKRAK